MDRIKHAWRVLLATPQDGGNVERVVRSYWDPDAEQTPPAVGEAARIEANHEHGYTAGGVPNVAHFPVSVERLAEDEAVVA